MAQAIERKPLYTATFGMQVFFNGDFYTLCNAAGGITASVNRPIAGLYFVRHSLSIPELIDITECMEWFLLKSGIPVVSQVVNGVDLVNYLKACMANGNPNTPG
jgi:hypothetical protein